MRNLADFQTFFETELVKDLLELEARRKGMFNSRMQLAGVTLAIIVGHWALVALGFIHPYTLFVTMALTPFITWRIFRKYYFDTALKDDFKRTVITKIVQFVDSALSYDPNGHIAYEEFKASELFLMAPDYFGGDDLIKGQIDGNPVTFSELHASYQSKAKFARSKKQHWKPIFDGIYFIAEMPRAFQGKHFILADPLRKQLGYTGRLIQENSPTRGQYLPIDNADFNDYYAVYSTDPLEAELLLTPNFQELIFALKRNSGADVSIAMHGQRVYLALQVNKEFFEPNFYRSLLDWNIVKDFFTDLVHMLHLVDSLDLDETAALLAPAPEQGVKTESNP